MKAWIECFLWVWFCVLVGAFMAWIVMAIPIGAQQRPYVGYAIHGGCLYITPQGFAAIREFAGDKARLTAEGTCN